MNYFCSAVARLDDGGTRYVNYCFQAGDNGSASVDDIAEKVAEYAEIPVDRLCLLSINPVPDLKI